MSQVVARARVEGSSAPHYSTVETDREPRLRVGTRIAQGKLEIAGELARGGMSVVYRAIDHDDGTQVALKIVSTDSVGEQTAQRLRNEARLGGTLKGHPHLVAPKTFGKLDGPVGFEGRMYLVTELVEGTSLDQVMSANRKGLDPHRACLIARDVARALCDLHECGIVHRDIKPGNVLLPKDRPQSARLIDFGLAYATGDGWAQQSPDLTKEGDAPGTLLYMSPQQLAHKRPAPSMDIYSLGVMMYEMFAGNPPYHRSPTADLIAKKCDATRMPFTLSKMCPVLDRRLADLVHRCLDYYPEQRPEAGAVVVELDAILTHDKTRISTRLVFWGSFSLLAVFAIVVGALWHLGDPSEATTAPMREALPASSAHDVEPHTTATTHQPDLKSPPAAVEPGAAPESPATATPRDAIQQLTEPLPPKVKRRKPAQSQERPAPSDPQSRCPADTPGTTEQARKERDWRRVLNLTGLAECWPPGQTTTRTKHRMRALLETERYAECVTTGKDSADTSVARWAAICETHLDGGTP
jgi:eukaryotic-like serine/threonine-protein kinase